MTRNTFSLGKLVVIGLALGIPLILYRSLESRVVSLRRDAQLQSTFGEERNRMVRQVLERQLQSGLPTSQVLFERELPEGPILGLPPFPRSALLQQLQLANERQPATQAVYWDWLNSAARFPSGLPKRFAAWLELGQNLPLALTSEDQQRFLEVAEEFWQGKAVGNDLLRFLISQKLNPALRPLFDDHLLFLGAGKVPADGRIWLGFTQAGIMRLAALPQAQRTDINRDLQALSLGTALEPTSEWTELGNLRVSLEPVSLPLEKRIRREWLVHGGLLLILELVCLLIYSILHKYQKVHRLQKQLLASTSHELRTPLAVIRQFSEMLLIRPEQFPPKVQHYHHYIYKESLKLQFLVENLLSAAKFENLDTTPRPVPLNLATWLSEEVEALKHIVGDHQIHLKTQALDVLWDPDLVSQVLTNLIDNAAKHAKTDIEVTSETQNDRVQICIRDFGTDFDLEKISQIKAFQSQATTKTSLGLGLFLCSKIAQAHGGSLQFQDAAPGLRVVLDLPQRLAVG